jgi:hypothetical protein
MQRHIQEMAAMASRPFATCHVDIVSSSAAATVPERADVRASSRRKKVKTSSWLMLLLKTFQFKTFVFGLSPL